MTDRDQSCLSFATMMVDQVRGPSSVTSDSEAVARGTLFGVIQSLVECSEQSDLTDILSSASSALKRVVQYASRVDESTAIAFPASSGLMGTVESRAASREAILTTLAASLGCSAADMMAVIAFVSPSAGAVSFSNNCKTQTSGVYVYHASSYPAIEIADAISNGPISQSPLAADFNAQGAVLFAHLHTNTSTLDPFHYTLRVGKGPVTYHLYADEGQLTQGKLVFKKYTWVDSSGAIQEGP
jgi:hypothetical protein